MFLGFLGSVTSTAEIDSVPVYGASVAQSLDTHGAFLSATGALAQQSKGKFPAGVSTPPPAAADTAVKTLAARAKAPAGKFTAAAAARVWYDPKLAAQRNASSVAVPAYQVEVRGDDQHGKPGHWFVFIDAGNTGRVLDTLDVPTK